MSILVTGGSGFIGSHIVDNLLENDYKVKIFDIKIPHRKDVEFINGDITSQKSLNSAMKNVEYIYHIAALSNINKVAENPLKAVNMNIMGTTRILEAARKTQVKKIIFASSYFVDSGKGHLYATTKKASELIFKDYFNLFTIPYTILRIGTVYGPRSRDEDVISIFVKRALSHQPIIIYGDGKQSRNFIHVEDVATGCVAALKGDSKNKTYVLEGKRPITIKQVAETINKIIGDVEIKYKDERPEDFRGKSVWIENPKKDLRWEPKIDFEEGIKRYINWYQDNMKKDKSKLELLSH